MADTILTGDITVNYSDDNRWKSLNWSGSATQTYPLNTVYSALQDLFDETGQMDDGTVMSAETPTEYTIGIIDSGDTDPWYVTYELMEHIAGTSTLRAGALRTSSWTRATGTNIGIVVVPVTANTFASGDIGNLVEHAGDGDDGTLLDIIDTAGTDYLVIRPDTSAAGDDWDSASGTIQVEGGGGNSATQDAASVSGEQIWANFYSIGTIEDDTHIYFYQGLTSDTTRARVVSITDSTQDWWSDGHIDVCIFTKDYTTDTNPIIDGGYLKAFARKGSTYYSTFEASSSTTSGGSNPVPINTSADLDNPTGYKSITLTGGSGNWNVGDEIQDAQATPARAIITQVENPGATATLHYYLIDDPQNDITTSDAITNQDDTGTGTEDGSGSTAEGPALATWFTDAGGSAAPSVSFTHTTADIDDDSTNENYGIVIDCNNNTLSYVYEWLKYITRNGETTTYDGIEGEQYVGGEAYLAWTGSVTGTIAEGADVTQETSGATGTIVSYFDSGGSGGYVLLRDVRGTFATHATTETLTDNDNSGTVEIDSVATNFAPNAQSPFGSFPGGGTFFGARGVLLTDYNSTDENNFSLVDVAGGTYARPQAYSITVTNLVGTNDESVITDDRVTVFRLDGSGGSIDKLEYSAAGGETAGAATLVVDAAITTDTPGKTTGGVLRIRDADDNNQNYRIRYSSWATSTFTLANFASFVTTATTNTTQVTYATGGFSGGVVLRGDLVYNSDRTASSYVASVDSDTQLTIYPAIASQTTGDNVEINCIPVATVNTLDDVFIPLIDQYATASSTSVSIIYVSTIYYRARVRNVAATDPDGPIKPFEVDSSLAGANSSVQTVRTIDTIYQ